MHINYKFLCSFSRVLSSPHTIFDIVPRGHQFGLQFVHLVRLFGRLSTGTWNRMRPESVAVLPFQSLLPPALQRLLLHHSGHEGHRVGRDRVHVSEHLPVDSNALHCNKKPDL